MTLENSALLRLDAISKAYGGVHALRDVSLSVEVGEVHALCGENGAGKSTLIKILSGVVRPDTGTVTLNGHPLEHGDVQASERAGIAVIHQESTAFPDLNAIDNIFVGREISRWAGWRLDYGAMRYQAATLLHDLGESIDLNCPVGQLPLAQRQMVSMARALVGKCRLLIMDEPTASLSARETTVLLKLIRRLRGEGISVLYVSHRLEEIFSIADTITVLRDGRWIDTQPTHQMTRNSLIQQMVGRPLLEVSAPSVETKPNRAATPLLEVRHLTRGGVFHDVNLRLHAGEILGLGGLIGAGRSEVARAIFGIDTYDWGQILVNGTPLARHSVRSSLAAGLALVPEDRQHEGLVLPMSIRSNVSLAVLPMLCRFGGISFHREWQVVANLLTNLQVKCDGMHRMAATLSGGNQQKLVLGKWLATNPRVLILDEPTRGVDVGAKAQFHQLIRDFADRGMSVLVISSDLPELLSLSDRLMVMRQGHLVGELSRSEATQSRVLEMALPDAEAPAKGTIHV
ncbi:sugar ABC transporter ATP-binding protein [Schlesneria paludicola]|uniref:sugar ABC transporter ATP-binding protein n=1 Tax=Schlesneria paludicola TaxID=360056 RepID=UPI00029B24CC|nr:sugar ABC transporter ATP-binding protein [Schlesneria paludicola]